MQRLRVLLTFAALASVLASCAPAEKTSTGFEVRRSVVESEHEVFTGTWDPDQIKLSCRGPHCRPQVGMVVFALKVTPLRTDITRCTATLVGADLVLTAGHCVLDGREANFILPSGQRRITGTVFKAFTSPSGPGKIAIRPDIAVLRLESPFDNVTPVRIAAGATVNYSSLHAVVVNRAGDQNTYRLDALNCSVRRHDRDFPFDVLENPDLIYGSGCDVIPGNSGAPLFGERDEVHAVINGTVNGGTETSGTKKSSVRRWALATNARCFPIDGEPAAKCTEVRPLSIAMRTTQVREVSWQRITTLGTEQRNAFPTEMNVKRLRLVRAEGGPEMVQTIDWPTCVRKNVNRLTEIKFLTELVQLEDDESGRPRNVVKDRRIDVGRVVSKLDNRYSVEIEWSAPFGELETPAEHPGVRVGKSFSVELPRCPR